MIPAFPEFKNIDSTDRAEVESFTRKYPPYSDFNFVSLWAWDIKNRRQISLLNGNLIVKFTDYTTSEPFFSFLGTNKVNDTAEKIIQYAKTIDITPKLRLVPGVSAEGMDLSRFKVEEDRDNFDYVYSTNLLSELQGAKFKDLRRSIHKFTRENSRLKAVVLRPAEDGVQERIWTVLRLWKTNKITEGREFELEHEKSAMLRLFESRDTQNLLVTALIEENSTLAFSIEEFLPERYCMGHFWKADTGRPGIYDFLLHTIARYLKTQNVEWWNFEQDLGIEGLRKAKMSYRPMSFLEKFAVSLKT